MLTFFTTAKPFRGHSAVIQRNALKSWTLLHPDVEVILFGDEEGAAETARELGIRHEPRVERNARGTKYLRSFFDSAQQIARHDLLCYVNCDILLLSDFRLAVERVRSWRKDFLLIGRRWDTEIAAPVDFSRPDWEADVRARALQANSQRPPQWIDYFVFSKGLYLSRIPPFVVGRPGWDNWLVWYARASGVPVVDVSRVVIAVHQNHDYAYHPEGAAGVWQGDEAQQNYALLGGDRHFRTIENATHRLLPGGLRKNYRHYLSLGRRRGAALAYQVWFSLLEATRPVRHRLGLGKRHEPQASTATPVRNANGGTK
jgi:hypothetical protein